MVIAILTRVRYQTHSISRIQSMKTPDLKCLYLPFVVERGAPVFSGEPLAARDRD